jgi:hypothetical protein
METAVSAWDAGSTWLSILGDVRLAFAWLRLAFAWLRLNHLGFQVAFGRLLAHVCGGPALPDVPEHCHGKV